MPWCVRSLWVNLDEDGVCGLGFDCVGGTGANIDNAAEDGWQSLWVVGGDLDVGSFTTRIRSLKV